MPPRRKKNVDAAPVPEGPATVEGPVDFRYEVTRERTVFVFWRGRCVRTYTGREAERLIARLEGVDADGQQMVLAKATGNFKRGNERR